jgi:hypothetical protein
MCALLGLWNLAGQVLRVTVQGTDSQLLPWPVEMLYFGPVLLSKRVWWSSRLERLAVGTSLAVLVIYNAWAHGWHAASWPEPNWWLYVPVAAFTVWFLMERLAPFLAWLLWRPGRMTKDRERWYAGLVLFTPLLAVGGSLLFGWLAPAGLQHWMDVALVVLLLLVPGCLASLEYRFREGMPMYLGGWGTPQEVDWRRG